jgi:hypothetical protein
MAFEPGFGRRRGCLADMVRLQAAFRNDCGRACCQRRADQEFGLPGLVSAEGEARASSRLM